MLLNTKHFSEIEINDDEIITFEGGLPGFESEDKLAFVKNPDEESPFLWLQSIKTADLAFVIINPVFFRKDYTVTIEDSLVSDLKIENPEDVLVYAIVVVPEEVSKITANLKAPLIINTKNKKGKQVILDTNEYHVRHYILEELQKQEG